MISHHNILLNDFTTEKHGWSVDPHPQQTIKPTTNKTKNSKKANNNTHNINNHNKQTQPQQQNNKSQQKRIIRTNNKRRKEKKKIPSTFSLFDCIVFCVLCWLFTCFIFCCFLSALVCLICCCVTHSKPNVDWMVNREAMLVGTRQKLTSASVNSCQLYDSTVPLSDRQQPLAWR